MLYADQSLITTSNIIWGKAPNVYIDKQYIEKKMLCIILFGCSWWRLDERCFPLLGFEQRRHSVKSHN